MAQKKGLNPEDFILKKKIFVCAEQSQNIPEKHDRQHNWIGLRVMQDNKTTVETKRNKEKDNETGNNSSKQLFMTLEMLR